MTAFFHLIYAIQDEQHHSSNFPQLSKREIQEQCIFWLFGCILTMFYWSNLLISHNYHQMEQFQVGCAIKARVWLTAVYSICCLGFWPTAGDFLATCAFFHLSSFNSKMAWQQLRSHIRNELRHWQELRQLSGTFVQPRHMKWSVQWRVNSLSVNDIFYVS